MSAPPSGRPVVRPVVRPRSPAAAGLVGVLALAVTVLMSPPAQAKDPAQVRAQSQEQCNTQQARYVDQPASYLTELGFTRAWSLAQGRGVTVAVVDSGVDVRNPHLAGDKVLPGKSFISGAATEDLLGHGTAVASIIAGRLRQDKASAQIGAAPQARILPVRVFAYDKSFEDSIPADQLFAPDTARIAAGIRWAADNRADVINVSMSTPPTDPALPVLKAAVAHAVDKGVVVVASTGDQLNGQQSTQLRYPAAFPGVLGVAANNAQGSVDDFSVHGAHADVTAPGANVLIAFGQAGDCLAGDKQPYTSWSTGFVSALAAMLKERFPKASVADIGYRITASADRPQQGARDDLEGWGTIQPYDALTMSMDPRRAGPVFPGAKGPVQPPVQSADVKALKVTPDPLAPARNAALWWGLLTVGLAALALIARPLVGRIVSRR